MKRKFALIFIVICLKTSTSTAQVPPEIQNSQVIGINKLPARTAFWPSPNREEAKNSDYDHSVWVKSLNGTWQFHWSPDPQSRPVDFYQPGYPRKEWTNIEVPSTIEREGFGVPLYTNSIYPFKVNPPYVMGVPDEKYTTYQQRNPVGSYCRTFTVPSQWKGKQIILHLAGAGSAFFVWVNGQKAGYSQGSRLPAEFDLSQYLIAGENFLAIETYKYCDGSYLEDQDFWRLSGLFRDVFIRAVPTASLWDLYAQPQIELTHHNGSISLHYCSVNFSSEQKKDYIISVSVSSPQGKEVAHKIYNIDPIHPGFEEEVALAPLDIGKVELWYDEKPVQYLVSVELKQKEKTIEAYQLPVAFRKIEVVGNTLLLNGQKLKIRGVNRHEFSPDQGWTITKEEMISDLMLMKQAHINFVRNAHYPNDPRWYELCDRYGIMVMDEANVESHGLSYHKRVLPGDKPEWEIACTERMKRMVIRDRQFPCVTMWSLGNEAGYGNTFLKMREVTHKNDPEHRLIQYADMNLAADFDSQTYPTIDWLKLHLEGKAIRKGEHGESSNEDQHGKYPSGRPFVLNEYAHAMGNSLGNFNDYWQLFYENDMLSGGFVWDWVDQALWKNQQNHAEGFIYGGDFGDFPNDNNFCINGLIGANRIPHPHYYELQKVYQPVSFQLIQKDPMTIKITNRQLATNLNEYELRYIIIENGQKVKEGLLPSADIEPLSPGQIILPDTIVWGTKKECFITFQFVLRQDQFWAKRGDVFAWEQFQISKASEGNKTTAQQESSTLIKTVQENDYQISNDKFAITFDKHTGMISGYTLGGEEIIDGKVRFNFWRALTDNDKGWKVDQKMKEWENANQNYRLSNFEINQIEGGQFAVKGEYQFMSTQSTAELQYLVDQDGTIHLDYKISIPNQAPDIPRIGLQFPIHRKFQTIDWYGRGPQENYIDRKTGAAVGIYHSTLQGFITPYVRPQENANRCDIRWIKFSGNDNQELRFEADDKSTFDASVWPYSMQNLSKSLHNYELINDRTITVNIDCTQMGVGGDNSWGLPVNDSYLIKPGTYHYTFSIKTK